MITAPFTCFFSKTAINTRPITVRTTGAIVTHAAQMFIPLGELVDLEKEKARVEKELKKNSAELEKLNTKLNNPGFVNKAPEHVVADIREKAQKARDLIAGLEQSEEAMKKFVEVERTQEHDE